MDKVHSSTTILHQPSLKTLMNSAKLNRLVATSNDLAPLVLRVLVGIIFAAHGSQKLFGFFGGYGLSGTGQFFNSLGLHPGVLMALMAGSAEFFGGLALVLGFLVRPAGAVTAFTMLIAILSVHISKGFFLDKGGMEYALALFAASLSMVFSGGGRASVDHALQQ